MGNPTSLPSFPRSPGKCLCRRNRWLMSTTLHRSEFQVTKTVRPTQTPTMPRAGLRPTCGVLLAPTGCRRRPRSGASGHNRTHPEQTSRSERVSRLTAAVCDLSQKQRNQFHPIDPTSITTASTNHRRYLVAPPASGSWLGTTRRTIGAARRDGGGSAGSRHAAQVRHRPSGARQPAPSPMDQDPPPCWANVQRRPS